MMSKLSLLDKLKILGEVTSSSNLFILAIILLVMLAGLLLLTNTRTKKVSKICCIAIYGSLIIVSIIFYREELFNLFDYMMNNFFIAIYFPNLAIYFAAIIATNIILLISIFNRKITKWIRVINTTVFCIIHYLLILLISVVNKNNLDIFTQSSIYEHQEATALIELSSVIFITWILFLIIYKIIRIYQNKNNEEEVIEKEPEKIIIKEQLPPIIKTETIVKKKLPENIQMKIAPSMVIGNSKKKEEPVITEPKQEYIPTQEQFLDTLLRDQEIMKPKKVEKQQPRPKTKQEDIFDNLLTLDDYKKVLGILKTYQEKEKQEAKQQPSSLEDLYNRTK